MMYPAELESRSRERDVARMHFCRCMYFTMLSWSCDYFGGYISNVINAHHIASLGQPPVLSFASQADRSFVDLHSTPPISMLLTSSECHVDYGSYRLSCHVAFYGNNLLQCTRR